MVMSFLFPKRLAALVALLALLWMAVAVSPAPASANTALLPMEGAFSIEVVDSRGRGIPNAVVTLTATSGRAEITGLTDNLGRFTSSLSPDSYQVWVEARSFRASGLEGVTVQSGAQTAVKLMLSTSFGLPQR